MEYPVDFIHAFTEQRFQGNAAAVMLLDNWLDDALMQNIATENRLSETAFVVKENGRYHIRWFSPMCEIDFCGHATLASAMVLFERHPELEQLPCYAAALGEFEVYRGAAKQQIVMRFPQRPPQSVEQIPSDLLEGLSIQPQQVLRSQQAYFAIYASQADVEQLETKSESLAKLKPYDVVATAPGNEHDFVSRYFWPANGGDEDPVTGSIHAGLAPYWGERLGLNKLSAYQASQRGGLLHCQLDDDQVLISGSAVRYLQGSIFID